MAETMRKNTDAGPRGGVTRSSVEAPVMGAERRGDVILPANVVNLGNFQARCRLNNWISGGFLLLRLRVSSEFRFTDLIGI
ncbi:hypothetical protein, partial [Caballeronia humi]|uniref:hypothetical protein n=1 Tax=Caballeronia humi TaxID=326474 RepID=UPI000F73AA27